MLVGPTRPWAHELPDVILTGQVSDEQLAAIYSGAHALVLPSEDEGFGLPAVEALACGTPVVACEVPALREVLGERATFVAPGDMEGLIAAAAGRAAPGPAAAAVDAGRTRRAPPGACMRAARRPAARRAALARRLAAGSAAPRARGGAPRSGAGIDGLEPQ